MSIAQHFHSLQQHLARLGLQLVPSDDNHEPEVFKACFLNEYEMQRWRNKQGKMADDVNEPTDNGLSAGGNRPG